MTDAIGWTEGDYKQLVVTAHAGRFEPEHWLSFASNESGLSTHAKNKDTGAAGLWQVMPKILQNLGWPGGDFTLISAAEQIRWSGKYLESWRLSFKLGRWRSGGELYLCNFAPAHLAASSNPQHVIFSYDTQPNTYWVNRGLDILQPGTAVRVMLPPKGRQEPQYRGKGYINVQDMTLHAKRAEGMQCYKTAVNSLNRLLQTCLNARGESLVVDGIVGPKTLASLKKVTGSPLLDGEVRYELLK